MFIVHIKRLTSDDYIWVKKILGELSFSSDMVRYGSFMYDEFFKSHKILTNCLNSQHLLLIYDVLKYIHESDSRSIKFSEEIDNKKIDPYFDMEFNQKLSQVILSARGESSLERVKKQFEFI